ncbi:MAG: hypothetical protein ACR2QC_01585 [Gammaproteobacteria bacterium]
MTISTPVPVVQLTASSNLLQLGLAATQTLVAGLNIIIFDTEGVDADNEYNPATGVVTAATVGPRTVTGLLSSDDGAIAETFIYVDGAPYRTITLSPTNAEIVIAVSLVLAIGQTMSVRCNRATSGTDIVGDLSRTWLNIAK